MNERLVSLLSMKAVFNSGVQLKHAWRVLLPFVFFILPFAFNAAHAALPIQHWQTEQGARVYFVENHDLPLLDISIDFAAGSNRDLPAKSGLANLTLHMMDKGAAALGLDPAEIRRRNFIQPDQFPY